MHVSLTDDEALVLFEFLTRFSRDECLSIGHPSEETALWNLQCLLERELEQPLRSNYAELLEKARQRLRPGLD